MADNVDDLVPQFMAFSGCSDASEAASYLEMSGSNLETAVGLYMEHQGGGSGAQGTAENQIRAPDATRRMQLMDDASGGHGMMMGAALQMDPSLRMMHEMMEDEIRSSAFADVMPADAREQVNAAAAVEEKENDNGDDDDEEYNYEEVMDEEDEEPRAVEPPRLADMFAAPSYRFTTGGFTTARTAAKDSKRWLLVNIQRDAEFSSHALNRDVWGDELIENLVSEGFIFWQMMDAGSEGQTFTQRYQVNDFPHISIIDPRTGRLLWRKEGWTQENPVTAESLAQHFMDFCSSNTFDRPPQAPKPKSAANNRPPKRPIEAMTEDEQLAAAMRASVQDSGSTAQAAEAVALEGNDSDVEVVEDAKPAAVTEPTLNDELVGIDVGEEPADGARIQLRMPDGKRVVRKFALNAPVKLVYAFVSQGDEEARNGREFVLQAGYPPADLLPDIEKTIEECKLAGQAIAIRWKE